MLVDTCYTEEEVRRQKDEQERQIMSSIGYLTEQKKQLESRVKRAEL